MASKKLEKVVDELLEIDEQLHILFNKRDEIQSKLTTEERNKVFDMIMSDGKSHWV